jgi:hypothetical protein
MRKCIPIAIGPARVAALVAAVISLLASAPASAQEQDPGKGRTKAPAGYDVFDSDSTGSYFVARPLKEKYDGLMKRAGELRAEIDDARIDEATARREVDRLQAEIDEAIRAIDKAKLYVPGATVQNRAATRSIPLGPGDLLLVDAENVEIRGGDEPEVKCVVKKTVLGEIGKEQDLTPEFDGIELVVRKALGREMFGFYKTAADRPALRHEYEQFPFKPFLDREFTVVSIKGLTYAEGNRQVKVEATNAEGGGRFGSDWQRRAKLLLTVPKCQGVAVQGALGGFRVHSLAAPLMVQGTGNRDYQARYEVMDLGGPLTTSGIPIHHIGGVKGDVSIVTTSYGEDVNTSHGPDGVTMRPVPPQETSYKDIQGNLRARFCRAALNLEGISGRVDIENAFGKTVWRSDRPLAALDHRIVAQSGPIEVRFSPAALGKLRLAVFTECGAVRLPGGNTGLQSLMFHGSMGDVISRSWHGFFTGNQNNRGDNPSDSLMMRLPAALRGEGRSPGIDIISRAGTVTYESIAGAGR